MSNEQRAHDLAVAIVVNRGIEAHIDAYKTLIHEINKDFSN